MRGYLVTDELRETPGFTEIPCAGCGEPLGETWPIYESGIQPPSAVEMPLVPFAEPVQKQYAHSICRHLVKDA